MAFVMFFFACVACITEPLCHAVLPVVRVSRNEATSHRGNVGPKSLGLLWIFQSASFQNVNSLQFVQQTMTQSKTNFSDCVLRSEPVLCTSLFVPSLQVRSHGGRVGPGYLGTYARDLPRFQVNPTALATRLCSMLCFHAI